MTCYSNLPLPIGPSHPYCLRSPFFLRNVLPPNTLSLLPPALLGHFSTPVLRNSIMTPSSPKYMCHVLRNVLPPPRATALMPHSSEISYPLFPTFALPPLPLGASPLPHVLQYARHRSMISEMVCPCPPTFSPPLLLLRNYVMCPCH